MTAIEERAAALTAIRAVGISRLATTTSSAPRAKESRAIEEAGFTAARRTGFTIASPALETLRTPLATELAMLDTLDPFRLLAVGAFMVENR
jgi:hypothetical protein